MAGVHLRTLLAAKSKERPMNSQQLAFILVIDEAGLFEPFHEKANARTGRPNHLCQNLMMYFRHRRFTCSMPVEVGKQ